MGWREAGWGGEFADPVGGICRSCGRLLCKKHLIIPLRKGARLRDAVQGMSAEECKPLTYHGFGETE